jgi:hypothetical protein
MHLRRRQCNNSSSSRHNNNKHNNNLNLLCSRRRRRMLHMHLRTCILPHTPSRHIHTITQIWREVIPVREYQHLDMHRLTTRRRSCEMHLSQ